MSSDFTTMRCCVGRELKVSPSVRRILGRQKDHTEMSQAAEQVPSLEMSVSQLGKTLRNPA